MLIHALTFDRSFFLSAIYIAYSVLKVYETNGTCALRDKNAGVVWRKLYCRVETFARVRETVFSGLNGRFANSALTYVNRVKSKSSIA